MLAEFPGFAVERDPQGGQFVVFAVVLKGRLPDCGTNGNCQSELLVEFPDSGLGVVFSRFELAAGEFPLATHGSTRRPASYKDTVAADGDPCYRPHLQEQYVGKQEVNEAAHDADDADDALVGHEDGIKLFKGCCRDI